MIVSRSQIIGFALGLWILLASMLPAQIVDTFDLEGALQRIRSYYQIKNYQQALEETQAALARDPENVSLRTWELRLLLSRESFPEGTQFDLILEDVAYLDSLNRAGRLSPEQAAVLTTYHQSFADLVVSLSDAPALGYYVARVPLKFLPPIQLSPIQQARLDELNRYFQSDGRLYFDRPEGNTGQFTARLAGFPILPQRLRTVRYRVAIATTGDTLALPFNRRVQKPLALYAAHAVALRYQLPPDRILLLADRDLRLEPIGATGQVYRKEIGQGQALLLPAHAVQAVQLGAPSRLQQQLLFWGGILSGTFLVWQLAR